MAKTVHPHKSPKYVATPSPPRHLPFSESVKWHLFFVTLCRLQAKPYWPLAGYYAYLDTGVYDSINFNELGLLWTDELGSLHFTGSDGRPTQLVTHFAFAWSSIFQNSDIETCTLIYGESPQELNQLKRKVEQAGKGSSLAAKYAVRKKQLTRFSIEENEYPNGLLITVPRDDDLLPLGRLETFMVEQEENLKTAHAVKDGIQRLVTAKPENQVIFFHRQQINDWLNKPGKARRSHLFRVHTTDRNSQTRWDFFCDAFDRELRKLVVQYEDSLDPFFEILTNDDKMTMLGQIGLIVEDWENPAGEHLLWRHQFLTEIAGLFCGTRRHKEVFEKVVQPVAQSLSYPFSLLRVQCKCPTCGAMVEGKTATSLDKYVEHKGWKSKDLKIATSTLQRSLDLFTKFAPNWAWLLPKLSEDAAHCGIVSWWFFVRAGVIAPGKSSPQVAEEWFELVVVLVDHAKKGEGQLDALIEKSMKFLNDKIPWKAKNLMETVGDFLGFVGAGILTYYVLSKSGKLSLKDSVDLMRALTDTAKAGLGLSKKGLERAMVTEFGEETGKQLAKSLPEYVRIASFAKYVGVAGGALQVASSWLSLRDAADKGDKREFAWVAVQYTGADIAFSGVVLDALPEPVVSKGSGIALNVIGGIVYVVGQIGEFFTRPGDEELFLREHIYYDDGDYGPQ